MFVLVTGGAGFIGAHSVRAMLDRGWQVRVLDNFSSGRRENLPQHSALEVIAGDVRDRSVVAHAVAGVDAILHLAAQVSVTASIEAPADSAGHNIAGYLNVLDAARHAGIPRVVHASSAAVYGTGSDAALDENAPTLPLSPYGLEKVVNDQYARLYRELFGISTLGLRYFNVYGPGQDPASPYSGVISIFCDRLLRGQAITIFGDGQQTRDFIYVGDIAAANLAALQNGMTGVCNVATGHSVSLIDMLASLSAASGRTVESRHAATRVGDIRHSRADNRRLRQELGFDRFTELHAGLRNLWAAAVAQD